MILSDFVVTNLDDEKVIDQKIEERFTIESLVTIAPRPIETLESNEELEIKSLESLEHVRNTKISIASISSF